MKDRSLDEFLDDGDDGDETPSDPGDENEPATARWTPGGAVCEECGDEVSRLWNDGGRDCCRSCKQW